MRTLDKIFKALAITTVIAATSAAQAVNLTNGEWLAAIGGNGSSANVTVDETGVEFDVNNGTADGWATIETTTDVYDWSNFTSINITYTSNLPIKVMFSDPAFWETGGAFEAQLPAAPASSSRTIYLSDFNQPSWVNFYPEVPKPNFASRLEFIRAVAVAPTSHNHTTGKITDFTVKGLARADGPYTILFNSNGGTAVSQITNVANGSTISKPSNPTKTGHAFAGWFTDAALTEEWNFATDVVTKHLNLFAKWTVNSSINLVTGDWFAANAGSGSSVDVTVGSNGIEFTMTGGNGWIDGSSWAAIEFTTSGEYDWNDFISIDITYTSDKPIKVTFSDMLFWETGGGFEAQLPAAATPTNKTIKFSDFRQPSWVLEFPFYVHNVPRPSFANRLEDIIAVAIAPAGDGNATGKITNFTVNGLARADDKHSVSFSSNGGSAVGQIINVAKNSIISQPSNPTRNGYAFVGWFKNADLTNQWNFATDVVTENITLYAKWTIIPYTIEYVLDGGTNNGSNPTSYNIQSENLTIQPASKTGYIFGGWFANSSLTGIPINSIFAGSAGNYTLYAKWKVNSLEAYGIRIPPFFTAYTGSQIKLPPLEYIAGQNTITLTEGADYIAQYSNNTNVGTASVTIMGIGNYSSIGTNAYNFEIYKRIVNVIWGDPVLGWRGEAQAPTARSSDELFPVKVTGQETEIGNNYTATAELANPNTNIVLINTSLDYSIVKRYIEIVWENTGPFVYNKMVQVPKAVAAIDKVDGRIDEIPLVVLNTHSQVGVYTGQQAPLAFIIDETTRNNVRLTNNTIDYEILKKPLDIVMTSKDGETTDNIVVNETSITDEAALLEYVKDEFALGYIGFAKDTITEESDNKNVLNGEPTFEIQKTNAARSVEKGEYVVKIKTNGVSAKNYSVKEKEIIVYVVGSNPVPISDISKSDSRYGIRFAKNIVSDKLEIADVILPKEAGEVAETKVAIYDNTGNVVWTKTQRGKKSIWDLRNESGRSVANGGYLVIVEAKSNKGKVYWYSAKVGVRR